MNLFFTKRLQNSGYSLRISETCKLTNVLGTIDYVDRTDGTIVFRTCNRERDRVVLQLGTSDAGRALKVGKMVENDVAGIDINMGCPKKFSINGGMGAALLKDSEKAKAILKTLVDALSIPVTCKIRVFSDVNKTLDLCDVLVSSGISAITVHGRTVDERPQHPNRNETISRIAKHLKIPVIANGGSKDIEKHKDILKFKEDTGASSVMLARAAQWNCSIFRKQGLLPMEDVIQGYLRYSIDYDNAPSNTKYCVQNIIRDLQESPLGKKFLATQTLEQICDVWGMGDYCRQKSEEFQRKGLQGRFHVEPASRDDEENGLGTSKRKFDDDELTVMRCAYLKNNYSADDELPKTRLYRWIRENKKKMAEYDTWYEDKLFRSVVTVDGKKYSSTFWEKNKKWAEQGAALVCLCALNIIDKETLRKSGNLLGSDCNEANALIAKKQKST
ncbi:tRNA-dihydrouridine(20) synthase [NAD(P)+]-like isoform X2 [Venturia canescens]|uniref:tRNA-dihydrouridine(20) synthase [NAD(P)+]-like isoform X2 n=1 Tax=Venturia canescens TaxID=32260 RepID=UPI001C9BC649|nr:tRNA-dihydrouridine(20) synthase [NAD(P)+]-like isoform X2 [Venturia canescens]